jgi:hypothetical protein
LWALFAACLGAGLGAGLAGSGAGSGTIAAGVVAVSGMVGADGGALVSRMSRRLRRVSRLKIELMEFQREAFGGDLADSDTRAGSLHNYGVAQPF